MPLLLLAIGGFFLIDIASKSINRLNTMAASFYETEILYRRNVHSNATGKGTWDVAFALTQEAKEEAARKKAIPEVHAIKARCRINWASVSSEEAKYDEALDGLKRMFETNTVLTRDMSLRDLAMVIR